MSTMNVMFHGGSMCRAEMQLILIELSHLSVKRASCLYVCVLFINIPENASQVPIIIIQKLFLSIQSINQLYNNFDLKN
jgi:hypothetical protein